jgi:hypothetical protein
MAIPELLVADVFKVAAQVQVYELVGGTTLNAIGTPIGANASESVPTNNEKNVANRVVEYRGELYMAYLDTGISLQIQRFNRGTGLWTALTLPALAGPNSITGLYVANTGNVQRLFLAMRDVGNGRIIYTDDGTTWNVTGTLFAVGAGYLDRSPGVMFNNKLYQSRQFNGQFVYEIDPIALAWTDLTVPDAVTTADSMPMDLAIHDDRLFLLGIDEDPGTSPCQWTLWEFTGSGFVVNTAITSGGNWNATQTEITFAQCCLFKDPNNNNLIALCPGTGATGGDADSGSTAHRLAPSGGTFTPTDITAALIPAAYRPGVRGTNANHLQDRWFCVVVNDTSPAAPEVYIFLAIGPAPGTGYTVYKYVTDATELGTGLSTSVAGPTTAFAIPHFKSGGGLRINKGTANQPAIEKGEPILGGYRISYRVYGLLAGQSVTLWYSLDQEAPDTQATISAQTGGSGITGGNTVTGITGDDGSTLFTLDWNLGADGVPNGDAAHIMLDIS